ncbi:MAG: penicillin-binding protein 1B [Oceanospirillaceae bacterium]|nr:penicillin-binding protein 1B [Oceanospirillaceae bacterium]
MSDSKGSGKTPPKRRSSASTSGKPGTSVGRARRTSASKSTGKTKTSSQSAAKSGSKSQSTTKPSKPSAANRTGVKKKTGVPQKKSTGSKRPASANRKSTATPKTATKTRVNRKRPTRSRKRKTKPGQSSWSSRIWRWLWRLGLIGMVLLGGWMVYLDAQVRQQFDGNKWALPARVYARPMTLYNERPLSHEQLLAELQWADYRPESGARQPGTYQRKGDRWVIHRRAFNFWDGRDGARRIELSIADQRVRQLRVNGSNQPLARLEPQYIGGIFPSHNEDRELVRLKEVPPALVGALVATEDQSFFEHWGISVKCIARAMLANIQAGGVVQGGSTLTQQLVKNFFLTTERTLTRKAKEALMALLLELHYSKEEILETYLNEVYLGQAGRRAIHGFGLASRFYFGKPVNELTLAESATLVGLVKGASYYNPKKHPERALERRNLVLELMQEQGVISQQQKLTAINTPLNTRPTHRAGQREYPAFLQLVKRQLREEYRAEDLQSEGLNIFTSLDPWVQSSLEQAAHDQLARLEKRRPELKGKLETAAVITSVDGGEVRGLLGGRDGRYFGFNRALLAQRSIGSLAKPVVFLAALESGRYHWGSRISDGPVTVGGAGGKLWQPKNYDGRNHGNVMLVDALAKSYNQSTARLGMKVGLDPVIDTFRKLGLEADIPPYPSIFLGSLALSPFQVAGFYQPLASSGFVAPLRSVVGVTTSDGKTLSSYAIQGRQTVDPKAVRWLRYGMEQVTKTGTARRLATQLPGPIAGKTGTSDQQRDAWFAGFDNRHLGVVWVGRDDNKPIPYAGGSAALPIWQQTFSNIGVEPLPKPKGFEWRAVAQDGTPMALNCDGRKLPFPQGRFKRTMACSAPAVPATEQEAPDSEQKGEKKSSGFWDWLF